MPLIDLHCDTLTDCMYAGSNIIDTLDDPARTLSLTSIPKDIHWAQFFAVFVPDELRGEKAIRFFDDACANFDRQMRKFADLVSPCRNVADMERAWAAGKTAAFLSVENGSAFAGDLSRIGKTKRQGVCAVTLTWNGENELGSGNVTDRGLTDFGRAAVREMERCGIFDRRLAPERRGARGRVRDGGKAVSRHALQRPRNLRAQAQPDGRADQGDGAPRLPDRPQLLRAIPARRGERSGA